MAITMWTFGCYQAITFNGQLQKKRKNNSKKNIKNTKGLLPKRGKDIIRMIKKINLKGGKT